MTIADVSGKALVELISLQGRTAVVTGAARGLGRAIASRLAEAGAVVLLADRDGNAVAEAAAELCRERPNQVLATTVDVTDSGSVTDLAHPSRGSSQSAGCLGQQRRYFSQ